MWNKQSTWYQRCVLEDKSLASRILENRCCGLGFDKQVLDNNTACCRSFQQQQLIIVLISDDNIIISVSLA